MSGPTPVRVLIVDDDPDQIEVLAAFAEQRGWAVLSARDGPEALVVAAAELPDLVLLDITMPKLDGRDVLSELRRHPRTAGLAVVAVSGRGNDEYVRENLLALGAAEVVAKPVDLVATFDLLERLCQGTGARGGLTDRISSGVRVSRGHGI